MDAISSLLRAAVRIADSTAAIVAFDDDGVPMAFTGCSQMAAVKAMREGSGAFIDCHATQRPMTLVLVEPKLPTRDNDALRSIATEIGFAVLDAAARFDADLAALASSIETLADPVVVYTPPKLGEDSASFACCNMAFERLFGWSSREIEGKSEDMLFSPRTNSENISHMHDRLASGEPVRTIVEFQTREEVPVWIEATARVVLDAEERVRFYVSTLRDITARKEFEAAVALEKQRLSVTLKAIGDAVITALPDGRIDFINAAAQRLLNIAFIDAYGMPLSTIVDLRDVTDAPREIEFDPHGDVRGEGLLQSLDRNKQVAFVSSPMIGSSGSPFGYVIVLRDVTAVHRLTRRLAYEASHDALTHLPNRRRFEEEVANALDSAQHTGSVHTVAFIDLDRFKSVNDTFGHDAGDRMLRDIAQRMSLNVRGNDVLARLGGDEFALLLHECTPANAERVAEKIRAAVEDVPVEMNGKSITVGASVGLARLDGECESAAAVLAAADAACYEDKLAHRATTS